MLKNLIIIAFSIACLNTANAQGPSPSNVTLLPVTVVQHATAVISNSEIDLIMASATKVIAVSDFNGDETARVSFQRDGALASSSAFPCTVGSQADYDGAFATTAAETKSIKRKAAVVCRINWCGTLAPNIIGCGDQPGTRFMVVRYQSDEGTLFAHEYGHTKGLAHRSDEQAVMNPYICATCKGLNGSEAAAYRTASLKVQNQSAETLAIQALPVEDFVRQLFPHGIPYDEAKLYGSSALPTLRAMLLDKSEMKYWSNIVTVLGINGEKSTIKILKFHLERKGDGPISFDDYESRLSVLPALGYTAANLGVGAKDAIDYLQKGTDPLKWRAKKFKWRHPQNSSEQYLIDDLVSQSVLGLGLSGHQDALATLEAGAEKLANVISDDSFIKEAVKANYLIRRSGLSDYYRNSRPPAEALE